MPSFGNYTTWMTPSTGRLANDGIFVRALVMRDANNVSLAMITLDGIGSDGTLNRMAHDIAVASGSQIPVRLVVDCRRSSSVVVVSFFYSFCAVHLTLAHSHTKRTT